MLFELCKRLQTQPMKSLESLSVISVLISVWRHHVQDVPLPHHRREPPEGPGADGGERAVTQHSPTVRQAAAGGGRCQVG